MIPLKCHISVYYLLTAFAAFSTHVLTKECNTPRPDDTLEVVEYQLASPGAAGRDAVWDFSNLSAGNKTYALKYVSRGIDVIGQKLNMSRTDLRLQGDTLLWVGYERRNIRMTDSVAPVKLIYPLTYGDSISSPFIMKGEYALSRPVVSHGTLTTVADACGTLILPSGDTLTNALRLRTDYSIHGQMAAQLTPTPSADTKLLFRTYEWYAPGYRYPLFFANAYYSDDEDDNDPDTPLLYLEGYSCPPDEQNFSLDDEVNEAIRNEEEQLTPEQLADYMQDTLRNFKIENDGNALTISFDTDTWTGELELVLSDIGGILRQSIPRQKLTKGHNTINIDISALAPGEYALYLLHAGEAKFLKFSKH